MAEPRLTRRIQDSRIQRWRGLFSTTSGAGLAERFDPAQRMTNMLGDAMGVQAEETGVLGGVPSSILRQSIATEPGTGRVATMRMPKLVEPEELNRRHAGLGLKFERPMTEEGAQRLADLARARRIRDSVIRREPEGLGQLGLGLGASLLNMALDPLEVASVFVPVVSQARQAAWIARSGAIAGRARVGVVESAAGNLMMEPTYMSLSKSLQMDYGMGDAIANVFLGSVLGGALGGGLGAARLGRRRLTLTEDMRVRRGEATEIDLDTLDVGGALNLNREQRALLPTPVEGRSGLTLRPANQPIRDPSKIPIEMRGNNYTSENFTVVLRRKRGKDQATLEVRDRATKEVIQTVQTQKKGSPTAAARLVRTFESRVAPKAERMELVDAEGNVIPLDPDQQAALAAAINGPSAAQRGQALKGAIAQMAQGKSVRVAETAEDVSRLKNRERLARGRVTQIRNELERVRTEGDAERVSDLEGRLARAEDQHRIAKAEVEAGQATTAGRVAQEEQQLDRSAMYEPEKVTELEEKAKRTDIPDETEVDQEINDLQALLKQKVEAGEMDEDALQSLVDEMEQLDGSVEAFGRATEYMKLCLSR